MRPFKVSVQMISNRIRPDDSLGFTKFADELSLLCGVFALKLTWLTFPDIIASSNLVF